MLALFSFHFSFRSVCALCSVILAGIIWALREFTHFYCCSLTYIAISSRFHFAFPAGFSFTEAIIDIATRNPVSGTSKLIAAIFTSINLGSSVLLTLTLLSPASLSHVSVPHRLFPSSILHLIYLFGCSFAGVGIYVGLQIPIGTEFTLTGPNKLPPWASHFSLVISYAILTLLSLRWL